MKVISVPPDGELDALREECDDEDTVTTELRNRLNNITNEFKLMSHLQGHSNIVSYQDHEIIQRDGELGWDVLIRMELLTSLSVYTKGSAMDEAEVIRLGLDMCRALARCEKHNILHRDIKPQNVFVNKDGDFKLGDFGVARFSEHMTASTVAGTYDYMAPEVYSYLFNKASYDKRVDIYSLGLVLYWLLNERRGPFLPLPPEPLGGDKRAEATQRRMSGELLPRPAHGSQGLQDIVLKACAFKPEDRYQSAEEFYNALNAQRQAQGAEAIPIPVQKLGSTEETEESSESDNGSAPVNESAFAQEEAERGKTLSAFNGTVYAFADDTDFQKAEKPQKRKKLLPVCIAAACAVVLAVCVIGYFNCWLGHTWDEGSVTVAATHTAVGTKTYTCSVCGDTREESVDKLTVHTYDQQDVDAKYLKSEATCTEAAVYYYSCACGEKGTDTFLYGEPNGHSWDNGAVTTVATHMSTGIETYTCSVCGETKEETIAKLAEHTYDQENADVKYLKSAATCTEAAVYYYSCECGEKGTKTFTSGSANGHQWDSGTVTKAATHTSTGTKRFTCKACGGTREETVAKLTTHTYDQKVTSSKYLKSAATCTEAAVYYMSCECGEKGTTTFEYGKANGHSYGTATVTKIPTVSSTGTKTRTCSVCGKTLTTTISQLPSNTTATGTCGDNLYWWLDSTGTLTIGGGGEMEDYTVTGGSLTSDNKIIYWATTAPWNNQRSKITNIVIENGVTSIGKNAFSGCDSLISITISNSVTSIEAYAFNHCLKLMSITIPNSVTNIETCAFENCANLTTITIPDSVVHICNRVFSCCSSLTTITLPKSVTSIGIDVFTGCTSLSDIFVDRWNRKYKSIDGVLFSKDKQSIICYPAKHSGTDYIIPNSVTTIEEGAFDDCINLTSITIPNSVTSIGNGAFMGCSNLTTITIPDSVTSIGNWAFSCCDSLTSISIPDKVTSIEYYTFSYCDNLASVSIPKSVTSIAHDAFNGCNSLKDVNYAGTESDRSNITIENSNDKLINATWHYNS